MNPLKKIGTLFVVFGIVGLAAVFLWFKGKPVTPSENPLWQVDPTTIRMILLENKTSTTTLQQQEGKWMMTSPVEDEVDPTALDRLIVALKAFSLGSVISENPENYSRFQLKPDEATHLRVYVNGREDPVLSGFVGKSSANSSDSFFRLENKKSVYVAVGLPSSLFKKEPRDYRLAKIFTLDFAQIDSVKIKMSEKSWVIDRSSDIWSISNSKNKYDSFAVRDFVQQLDRWYAMEFGESSENSWVLSTTSPRMEIQVQQGEKVVNLKIAKDSIVIPKGPDTPEAFPVTVDNRKYVMSLPKVVIDEFSTQLKSFK